MPTSYKQAEVLAISGLTVNELQYSLQLGIIVPEKPASTSGDHREFSLQNVVEAAMARDLKKNGMSAKQLQILFAQLRANLLTLPSELRASAVFQRYVEVVDALVAINGPGPNYDQWRQDVAVFVNSWKRKRTPLDAQILSILASARAAERNARDAR